MEVHPSRVIEFSPDATHLCLGRGGLQLDLVELAGCSIVARIAFKSAPTAVLWKYSVPDFLIVGLRDGSFTIVTVDGESEVTFGRTYGLGGPAHVSAIAMSDVHGVLAIATGPIVRIYRFERGTRESLFSITSHFLLMICCRAHQSTFLTCVTLMMVRKVTEYGLSSLWCFLTPGTFSRLIPPGSREWGTLGTFIPGSPSSRVVVSHQSPRTLRGPGQCTCT